MAGTIDALRRAEAQLDGLSRRDERAVIDRWRAASAELDRVPVTRPAELQGWLRRGSAHRADEVVRSLVGLAQRGDAVALTAVLVCLAPGIRALARRSGVSADEAFSEVTLRILEYPVGRRTSVAGGILLDARNRLVRRARGAPRPVDGAEGEVGGARTAGPDGRTTAERVLQIICEARRRDLLSRDDAQLIVDTRLGGRRMAPAAARLGISAQAAYQRRARAERRMSSAATWA